MSSQGAEQANSGANNSFVERAGIPRPLFWGFVVVFLFSAGRAVFVGPASYTVLNPLSAPRAS